jgi:hypothetical protein
MRMRRKLKRSIGCGYQLILIRYYNDIVKLIIVKSQDQNQNQISMESIKIRAKSENQNQVGKSGKSESRAIVIGSTNN